MRQLMGQMSKGERWIVRGIVAVVIIGALLYSPIVAIAAVVGFVISKLIPRHHLIVLIVIAGAFLYFVSGGHHSLGLTVLAPIGVAAGGIIGMKI